MQVFPADWYYLLVVLINAERVEGSMKTVSVRRALLFLMCVGRIICIRNEKPQSMPFPRLSWVYFLSLLLW